MVRKTFLIVSFWLLTLLLQALIAPWLTISLIRPDFMLILVLFVARLEGKIIGQLFGFITGLLVDALGMGSFLGLSALAKTIAGYGAGVMRKKSRRWSPLLLYTLEILIVLVHFSLIYLINFKGADVSWRYIFLRYILPSSIYTLTFYYLVKHFSGIELT